MTKRKQQFVRVGFELGTGKPVDVPLAHTFVTGQTQLSGKTTTLCAIVTRSGRRSLVFLTKRGEEFEGRRIRPFLPREGKQPIHWKMVESILASALGEKKLKYERYQIIQAARGAKSLAGVRDNVVRLMAKTKNNQRAKEAYELIHEYIALVLPEMEALDATDTLDLEPGLNVMDLIGHSQQLQELVIRASLEQINKHEEQILTVFPEAWKFAPRGRVTPSSSEAVKTIREGGVIGNLLLCDSQDIAGVDTVIRQGASVWILGVQRELNELKRTLRMVPDDIKKPKPKDVTSLRIGQFIVCSGDFATRTYVQPAWMSEADAIAIAKGDKSIDDVHVHQPPKYASVVPTWADPAPRRSSPPASQPPTPLEDEEMSKESEATIERMGKSMDALVAHLTRQGARASGAIEFNGETVHRSPDTEPEPGQADDSDGSEPVSMTLKTRSPELVIESESTKLVENDKSVRGRIAVMIGDGFFQTPRIGKEAYDWVKDRGYTSSSSNVYDALASLVKDGFLVMMPKKKYAQHPALKIVKNGSKTVTLTINYK